MTTSRFSFYSLTTVVVSFGVPLTAAAQTAPAPRGETSAQTRVAAPPPPNSSASPEAAPNPAGNVSSAAPATSAAPRSTAPNADASATLPDVNSAPNPPDTTQPGAQSGAAVDTTGQPDAAPEPAPAPPPYPVVPDDAAPLTPQEPPAVAPQAIHEPPLPPPYRAASGVTPMPPPVPQHVAPRTSFWAGLRPTIVFPLGSMWTDREPVDYYCCSQNPRPFSEFATAGPGLGIDVGARFARSYQAFAFGEYTFLGAGPLEDAFGGQESATTSMFGIGVRFATHPDSLGFLIEMSLGYRSFEATWKDGTKLSANDDLFSTRFGVGGIWQINGNTSVEVMFVLGGGSFTDIEWTFADGSKAGALSGYDDRGQYIPIGFQAGVHWDIVRSKD